MPKTSIAQINALYFAVARYIAERPAQADSAFHFPSFAHCFADQLAGIAEQDLVKVFSDFIRIRPVKAS